MCIRTFFLGLVWGRTWIPPDDTSLVTSNQWIPVTSNQTRETQECCEGGERYEREVREIRLHVTRIIVVKRRG
jgi:hypothetical protein